jgi:hypothetical protein
VAAAAVSALAIWLGRRHDSPPARRASAAVPDAAVATGPALPSPAPSPREPAPAPAPTPAPAPAPAIAPTQAAPAVPVRLRATPAALIYQGSKPLGKTPRTITVLPGRPIALTLRAHGFEAQRVTLDGEQRELDVRLERSGHRPAAVKPQPVKETPKPPVKETPKPPVKETPKPPGNVIFDPYKRSP